MSQVKIKIIGGGLSGCEAALQLADRGFSIDLWEMRPQVSTPAHRTGNLAELVCSNSFKGTAFTSAHGLFKEELRLLGAKLLPLAQASRVEAGESLAVDRDLFAQAVSQAMQNHPGITIHREEITSLDPHEPTLLAAGPLCSDKLAKALFTLIGSERLSFYDSIAPVVEIDSVDMELAYAKNRWDKGDSSDFINCPLTETEYKGFVEALCKADRVEPKPFEKGELFEGCLPVEEMARRGLDTLRYGPMRPVGLRDPRTGQDPHAVVQLRAENREKTLYNMVGFQTRLKWGTQKEIFARIPALRNAVYARLGAMHRNTFLDSPIVLDKTLRLKGTRIFCAGQITGAEGYTEALGTGIYAASMLAAHLREDEAFLWPGGSCVAALVDHLVYPNIDFQPMNFNFGLLPKVEAKSKQQKKDLQIARCFEVLEGFTPFPGTPVSTLV